MEPSELNPAKLVQDRESFLAHDDHFLGLPSLFYGSLQAPEVFEIVVGRPLETANPETVSVMDHTLARINSGDGFPGIFPTTDTATLDCLLVSELSHYEALRIAWFEWDEYRLGEFALTDGRVAQAFVPHTEIIHRRFGPIDYQPWSFEEWRDDYMQDAIPDMHLWMAEMPDVSARLAVA